MSSNALIKKNEKNTRWNLKMYYFGIFFVSPYFLGANGMSWATPTPLGDYLLNVYFGILLEYFKQKSLKNLEYYVHL
jgi:hypothetical protein